MTKLIYQPLSSKLNTESLSSYAGYHDLERVFILPKFAGNELVVSHEALHDRALSEISFGLIQSIFHNVYLFAKDEKIKRNAAIWTKVLFDESQNMHERYAIYLSIKNYPPEKQAELLSGHSKMYQNFYLDVANLVEPFFHSSFIQFVVANKILEFCFSSNLIEVLANQWTEALPQMIEPLDSPEKRFRLVLSITNSNLQDLVEQLNTEALNLSEQNLLPLGFDFQIEKDWMGLTFNQSTELDKLMGYSTIKWLKFLAKTHSIPYLLLSESEHYIAQFINKLGNNINSSSLFSPQGSYGSLDILNEADINRIRRLGKTQFENKTFTKRIKITNHESSNEVLESFYKKTKHRTFISNSVNTPPKTKIKWNFFEWDNSKLLCGGSISHDQFKLFLEFRKKLMASWGFLPTLDLIIVALNSNSLNHSQDIYTEILNYHKVTFQDTEKIFGSEWICWYMGGDFFHWYDFLIEQGGLEIVFTADPETKSSIKLPKYDHNKILLEDSPKKTLELNNPVLVILRSPRYLGYFFRIFPYGIWADLSPLLYHDSEKGKIGKLKNPEAIVGNLLENAFMPINFTWDEY